MGRVVRATPSTAALPLTERRGKDPSQAAVRPPHRFLPILRVVGRLT